MAEKPKLLRIPTRFNSVNDVLETAKKLNLSNVLVISQRENGNIVFLDTELTMAETNWLIDNMKMLMLVPGGMVLVDKING